MTISKLQCLYVFLILYGGAIIAIFLRAFPRRRLLADHDELLGGRHAAGASESPARRFLLALPRQSMALKDLGRSIGNAPPAVQSRYRRFQVLTWICFLLIALLVVFSLMAHKVCAA